MLASNPVQMSVSNPAEISASDPAEMPSSDPAEMSACNVSAVFAPSLYWKALIQRERGSKGDYLNAALKATS